MLRTVLPIWVGALLVCGCVNQHQGLSKPPYHGPTKSMDFVVQQVNENNQKIPTLWASLGYEATIVDENQKSHFVNGDGVLLYQTPNNLRLVGQKDLVGTVFEIGSNTQTYWLKILPEMDTLWIGKWTDFSESALARENIPIRPDMILTVLGVGTIDTNFNQLPAPTMRFNNDQWAYMFVWNAKLPDRWAAQREVWYDVETYLPRLVLLFDEKGRVVLRANLSKHHQIELEGAPKKDWPWVATAYDMYFPDSGSKMNLMLRDVMITKKTGSVSAPNPRSFIAPNPEKPGVFHVIEIR